MRRPWIVALVLCLLSVSPVTVSRTCADEEKKPSAASAPTNPWADDAQATALVQGYLQRMKLDATLDTSRAYPVLNATVQRTNATHHLRIVVDAKHQMVYLFLNHYLTAKPDSPQLPKVLQRLMEENWALNLGKFEWDRSDGEIRLSFLFTTENGVGYEAFETAVVTLLQTGDRLWPELNTLATT
jgi:hypothetical protein